MQFVDPSDPGAGAGLNELALGIVPLVCRFRSLEENQELCDRGQISGWRLHSLRGEGGPTADAVAGWVRRGALLRSVAEICPQAVLLLLARHVESLLLAVEIREAGVAQLRYGLLKAWLSQGVFPQQPWELVVRGWGLVEREARIFGTYGRLLSQIHSGASASGLGPGLPAEAACPGVRAAPYVWLREAPPEVEGLFPVGMVGVGNALSLYWNARGLARLAGVAFSAAGAPGAGHFIRHLPRAAPPPPRGNATALAAACGACPPREVRAWRYPHTCLSAWAHIRGEVQRDTHSALRASGAERKALARLRSSDVAVHLRCLPAFNANYPLAAFSLYADLPRPWRDARRLRFLILGGKLGLACTQVAAALEGYLQRRFPQARVLRQFNTTDKAHAEDLLGPGAEDAAEADFATMVHAPVLVRAPGSFSLWAGLARRRGVVLSAANPLVSTWDWRRADFGRDWSWSTAPLLTPEVVERHGFDFHRPEPWIEWLCSH